MSILQPFNDRYLFRSRCRSRAQSFVLGATATVALGHRSLQESAMSKRTDEAQIRTLVENWAQAVRAKDMDGALAHHTSDVVMFDVPMPLQFKGLDDYKKTWEQFFANSRGGPGSFDVTELQITAGETVAYAHAILWVGDARAR